MRHLLFPLFAAAAIAAQTTQSPDRGAPAFEVASVKVNRTGAPGGSFVMPPGRFTATNIPLTVLITNAYQLSFFQVVGGPDWATTDRFDIVAKAPDGAPPEQTRAMVRTLLKERFKLAVHMETRETPLYALVKARADDRLGPNLKRSTMDCAPIRAQRAEATAAAARARGGRLAVPPAAANEPVVCGMRAGGRGGPTLTYRAGNITMTALASALRPFVGREVVDRTGLTGEFDFDLQFSAPPGAGPVDAGNPVATTLDDAASVFTALQEQLGLKLESTRGPVEVLVIDSAEKPGEN
jgi:uncharacterized protein (TIGR03435 family)